MLVEMSIPKQALLSFWFQYIQVIWREVGVVAYVVIDKGRTMRGVNLNYPPFIL